MLPNLGWEKVNENLFQRDGEFLEIELKSDDDLSKIILVFTQNNKQIILDDFAFQKYKLYCYGKYKIS